GRETDSLLEGTGFELLVRGAREVGCRAPTAAKLNGSTKPAVDAHRRPSIGSYPAPGQEGKDVVVLDRWGEDRTEGAVSSLARSRLVSVLRRFPLGSRCNRVSALLRKRQLLARRDEAILSGRPAVKVERREILLEGPAKFDLPDRDLSVGGKGRQPGLYPEFSQFPVEGL